jgi:biopolymer transport protein TolR
MSEINVVPYIDVMLVLLIIFMVTAPLITQGVKVDLPQGDAQALEDAQEPLIISIDRDGGMFLNIGENKDSPLDDQTLMVRVAAVLKHKPETKVMVNGDNQIDYGRVVRAMILAQAAGAPQVGLMTDPATQPGR